MLLSFHTKKLFSRLSSIKVRFYIEIVHFAFSAPPPLEDIGASRAMYDDHLRLIGKRVLDFLLLHFFARCYGALAEALNK